MLQDIYHIAYLTDDMAAAIAFYQTVLGAELVREATAAASGDKMAFLTLGKSAIELIEPGDRSRLNGQTGLVLDHIGYVADDFDAAMSELAARGVSFLTPEPVINPEGARVIYLTAADTMGTRMHLTERPKG